MVGGNAAAEAACRGPGARTVEAGALSLEDLFIDYTAEGAAVEEAS